MTKYISILFISMFYFQAVAQVQQGGTPYSFKHNLNESKASTISFPEVDLQKLSMEDAYFDLQKDIPYRFGFNFEEKYNPSNSGEWTDLPNGDRVWRATFYSNGAQTLNFLLQNYVLAEGANLFFYNEDRSVVLGSFNHLNNEIHKNLATMPIPGDKITLEFYEPKSVKGVSTFDITRVTHGYRSIKIPTKAVGTSGSCNNNVICPKGDTWREQIRSVGIIIVNGNGNCTGALVNNTCEDKKPFFLTANHCTGGDVTTWSIGFNWESTSCNNNIANHSISLQSINVLALRAKNEGSDFALVELTQVPPINYNVFYAGWDRSGNLPTSQVAIHHPDGDLKKITFDNDAATKEVWQNSMCWRIASWDDGTTEPGSSGSPLFDQNKRIIGQLYGGSASCTNNINDYYGRFDISWDGGTNTTQELKSWLDPSNSNVLTLDGLDGSTTINDDITVTFLNKPNAVNCGTKIPHQIFLKNQGSNNATSVSFFYGLENNVQLYNWTGNLAAGQSTTINFDDLLLCAGTYNYTLEITSYNGSMDMITCNNSDNFSFEIVNGNNFEVEVKTNWQGNESSFEIYNMNDVMLYSQTTFGNFKTHNFEYCLPKGDYYFKMKDSGGNGLTPVYFYDNGYYTIKLDGVLLKNNSAFGFVDSTSFSAAGNGLLADFNIPPLFTNTPLNFISNSEGFPTSYLWNAPGAIANTGTQMQFVTSYANTGNYSIKLTILNDDGCADVEKSFEIFSGVGIQDAAEFYNVLIYPNPTEKDLYINVETAEPIILSMQNILGQEVYTQNINKANTVINVESFSKGLYYIVLKSENKRFVKKIILK